MIIIRYKNFFRQVKKGLANVGFVVYNLPCCDIDSVEA